MHIAKLIAISKPLGGLENLSPEELIVYMARVSSPNNQGKLDSSAKLLKYLLDHGHYSPFQMVTVSFEVVTTRAISRQLLRHRSLNFQEYSGRYSEMPHTHVKQECRMQDKKNRQASNYCDDTSLALSFDIAQREIWEKANLLYKNCLEHGIAKEVARSLLPEGLCESRLYVTGTVRDIMFYLKQRIGNGTQKEHELLAKSMAKELELYFPNTLIAMNLLED